MNWDYSDYKLNDKLEQLQACWWLEDYSSFKGMLHGSCLISLAPIHSSYLLFSQMCKLSKKEGDMKNTKPVNQTHASMDNPIRNLRITEDQFQDTLKWSYIIPKPWSYCSLTLQFRSLSMTVNTPVDSWSVNYLWFELICLKQIQSLFPCKPDQTSQNCPI